MKNLDTNHFTCDCNIEENNCGIKSRMLRAHFRFGCKGENDLRMKDGALPIVIFVAFAPVSDPPMVGD